MEVLYKVSISIILFMRLSDGQFYLYPITEPARSSTLNKNIKYIFVPLLFSLKETLSQYFSILKFQSPAVHFHLLYDLNQR